MDYPEGEIQNSLWSAPDINSKKLTVMLQLERKEIGVLLLAAVLRDWNGKRVDGIVKPVSFCSSFRGGSFCCLVCLPDGQCFKHSERWKLNLITSSRFLSAYPVGSSMGTQYVRGFARANELSFSWVRRSGNHTVHLVASLALKGVSPLDWRANPRPSVVSTLYM